MTMTQHAPRQTAAQRCINADCGAAYPLEQVLVECPKCGWLLDVEYDWAGVPRSVSGPRPSVPTFADFSARATGDPSLLDFSGVWRFRELLPFFGDDKNIVTVGEGRTILQRADRLAKEIGLEDGSLHLQYEGFNPSGSFKDNGMAAAFTHAKMVGASRVACASTGNTSASLALYGSRAGMRCFVFIGEGKIAFGKLSQALDYGAVTLQIAGDFDACLARLLELAKGTVPPTMPTPGPVARRASAGMVGAAKQDTASHTGIYLMNSVNPFRLEGQKTIMYRVLEGLQWRVPDWVVVPGGNLGNCSAFGKAFIELKALGMIDRLPRLAVIQAKGARTLDRVYNELGVRWVPKGATQNVPLPTSPTGAARNHSAQSGEVGSADDRSAPVLTGTFDTAKVEAEYSRMSAAGEKAKTIASAIEINRPVNLSKALRALHAMNGVVRSVSDEQILEFKAAIGRHGFGCEPASAASVAGASLLVREGVIAKGETVACILTGHVLKDPDATVSYHTKSGGRLSNAPIRVRDDLAEIVRVMESVGTAT
jgi:threonine synthase